MTPNHLTAAELAAYHARQLPPGKTLDASDHLAACEECRAQLLKLASSDPTPATGKPHEDLSYEDLAGWLDDELDPLRHREVAAALAHSARARTELADLARFRDEMNSLPARDHAAAEPTSPQMAGRAFPRWMFPLAAAVVLSGAAVWLATKPQPGAADFVKLRDGERVIGFAADGRSPALAGLPQPVSDAIAQTIRTGRIDVPPEIAALTGQTGTLAGAADDQPGLRALEPLGTAVRDARPRFRWSAAPEASAYKINVVEETSGALVLSQQLPPDTTEWQPGETLPAGEVYQWEVQALRDGTVIANSPRPPEPEARFHILPVAKLAELEEAKRASNGSHLAMAVANARAGLLDEAVRELRFLSEQNPDAELPRQLLQQLQAQRSPQP
jgi:hypothetical protein